MAAAQTIRDLLQSANQQLANIDNARLDCELLLATILEQDRNYLYTHPEAIVSLSLATDFSSLIAKRATGYPLAYLIGNKEFWSLQLTVTTATLIPRPETELLVETLLELTDKDNRHDMLDLGTGTGAIAIAVAKERPLASITATDISTEALATAVINARRHKTSNIRFIKSDWFSELGHARFNYILSNPPYVETHNPGFINTGIRYEPRIALDGGNMGLQAFQRIISAAGAFLANPGWLVLEHGYTQGQSIRDMLKHYRFEDISTRRDYAGHERISLARYPL